MRVQRGVVVGLMIGTAAVAVMALPAIGQKGGPATSGVTSQGPVPALESGAKPPVTDPRQDGLYVAQDRSAPILAEYPDADAGAVWDMDSQTLTFRLVDNDQGRQARAALAAMDVPVNVAFAPAAMSSRQLMRASTRLIATRPLWAPGLDGQAFAVEADVMRGALVLHVDRHWADQWRAAAANAGLGVPVLVRAEQQAGVVFQSAQLSGTSALTAP